MKGRHDNYERSPSTNTAASAWQVAVAVTAAVEGNLHLHELKDLSNEHAGEAILLMQVIDVKATVKENSMETPL